MVFPGKPSTGADVASGRSSKFDFEMQSCLLGHDVLFFFSCCPWRTQIPLESQYLK